MKTIHILLIAAVMAALFTTGCKKNDNTTPAATGRLYFHLHTNIDTSEVDDYGEIYTTTGGRKISLTMAQLYISNIKLVKEDGTLYSIPDSVVLKQLDPEEYFVATVPTGNYKSVQFSVGLDAATNAATSTLAALMHPEMWFGSSAQPGGYVFVNVQGSIDTTTNANGTAAQMQPFMYEIGTNAHLNQVTMPDHTPVYSFTKDQTTFIHLIIDYSKLFNGVQLNKSNNLMIMTASDNTSAVSNTVSNNIVSMFSYEE